MLVSLRLSLTSPSAHVWQVQSKGRLIRAGANNRTWTHIAVQNRPQQQFIHGFGDHNGFIGALDTEGEVYLVDTDLSLALLPNIDKPGITHIALAGNNRVVIAFYQVSDVKLANIVEFPSIDHFKIWYSDPLSTIRYPHTRLSASIKQLTANATTFVCLMSTGEVYTWGDARHRSLGRNTVGENTTTAEEPGLVDALGGVKVVKVSAGGWMTAALSEDGAVYLWGTSTPGSKKAIRVLETLEPTEVALLEILDDDGETEEPVDFKDVAVGDGHVVLLTDNGKLYSGGENTNGQLGMGQEKAYLEEWKPVSIDEQGHCNAVWSGPRCTIIGVKRRSRKGETAGVAS